MDWMLKHPGEASSLAEVRNKRLAEEREIERKAQEEREAKDKARAEARAADLEAFAIGQLNKHIVVTIQGRRLSKMSSWDDLKCDKCGAALYKVRSQVMQAADTYRRAVASNTHPPGIFNDPGRCKACDTMNTILVQVIY